MPGAKTAVSTSLSISPEKIIYFQKPQTTVLTISENPQAAKINQLIQELQQAIFSKKPGFEGKVVILEDLFYEGRIRLYCETAREAWVDHLWDQQTAGGIEEKIARIARQILKQNWDQDQTSPPSPPPSETGDDGLPHGTTDTTVPGNPKLDGLQIETDTVNGTRAHPDEEQAFAAIRIQSLIRGRLTRKKLQQTKRDQAARKIQQRFRTIQIQRIHRLQVQLNALQTDNRNLDETLNANTLQLGSLTLECEQDKIKITELQAHLEFQTAELKKLQDEQAALLLQLAPLRTAAASLRTLQTEMQPLRLELTRLQNLQLNAEREALLQRQSFDELTQASAHRQDAQQRQNPLITAMLQRREEGSLVEAADRAESPPSPPHGDHRTAAKLLLEGAGISSTLAVDTAEQALTRDTEQALTRAAEAAKRAIVSDFSSRPDKRPSIILIQCRQLANIKKIVFKSQQAEIQLELPFEIPYKFMKNQRGQVKTFEGVLRLLNLNITERTPENLQAYLKTSQDLTRFSSTSQKPIVLTDSFWKDWDTTSEDYKTALANFKYVYRAFQSFQSKQTGKEPLASIISRINANIQKLGKEKATDKLKLLKDLLTDLQYALNTTEDASQRATLKHQLESFQKILLLREAGEASGSSSGI
jgi:hypothetical protein